ncbi:MAG: MaoC family dehydratase, partial [Proteobacteria bacterium]|nr:MaoC family dehydratase [Pseudomonadota bacterium]
RWVMGAERDPDSPEPEPVIPELPEAVALDRIAQKGGLADGLDLAGYDTALAGSPDLWDDYRAGERIDHRGGVTMEEAEHMMATRLYQNTAGVHFDGLAAQASRFGRRIVYGGHVISHARALSFNGLANAISVAAINGGRHVAPLFAGDTLYAWSEVLEKSPLAGRTDLGTLRLRTVAAKDYPCADFPYKAADGGYHPAVVLELDYTVLMPRHPPGEDGK